MILAGRILKTWGNRGEVVLEPVDDFPPALHDGDSVTLKSKRHTREMTIAGIRLVNGCWLIHLHGVDNIGQALPLVGCELFGVAAQAGMDEPEPPIGYEVIDLDGESWGRVIALRHKPAPLLEVAMIDGESRMIPFDEHIVIVVDQLRKRLRIDPPAGLKDLNG